MVPRHEPGPASPPLADPSHICIDGRQRLDYRCAHLMLEAAFISLPA